MEQAAELNIELVNFPYDSTVFLQDTTLTANFKVQRSFRDDFNLSDILVIADLNNMHSADSTITLEVMDQPRFVRDVTLNFNRIKVQYADQPN